MVNNGKKARFWIDVWLGNCPFSIVYSRIFNICNEQEELVYNVLKSNEIKFQKVPWRGGTGGMTFTCERMMSDC